jgi:hypothetical protein
MERQWTVEGQDEMAFRGGTLKLRQERVLGRQPKQLCVTACISFFLFVFFVPLFFSGWASILGDAGSV